MKIPVAAGIATGVLGLIAAAVPAAQPVLNSSPVAQLTTKSTTPPPTASPTTATPKKEVCDDGRWVGPEGINVEGKPDGFDAGDDGAAYIWHDSGGWHLRTTDVKNVAHHYSGAIRLSRDASFENVEPVRNESDDKVWVTGDNVLHYSLVTYSGIDGFDFRVSHCAGSHEHEAMHFALDYNGKEHDPARIFLGDQKQHPPAASFTVHRGI